jgi:hypothetical protein
MDTTSCLPTPPCLNISLYQEHPAIGLHRGWCAARDGLACDAAETPAYREGWALWHRHHPPRDMDAVITACVRELRGVAREMAMPPVRPRF